MPRMLSPAAARAGIRGRAVQTLLFAIEGDEDERGFEVLLRKDAGDLHHRGRAAGVVVGAGVVHRVVVGADDIDIVRAGRPRLDADDVVVGLRAVGERIERRLESQPGEIALDVVAGQIVFRAEAAVVAAYGCTGDPGVDGCSWRR